MRMTVRLRAAIPIAVLAGLLAGAETVWLVFIDPSLHERVVAR